jgi:CheY-like chemotaxis protein
VLVVDDNADAAESMALLLAVHGHDVRQARSGPEAIATARTFAPDVMLLDLGLPEMDGYAVAEAVRREPALAGCRLVAVTGYGRDEDRRRAREAGFDEHLLKPVDPAVLQTVVASA